jgi:Flp pilus assembly protein TadG
LRPPGDLIVPQQFNNVSLLKIRPYGAIWVAAFWVSDMYAPSRKAIALRAARVLRLRIVRRFLKKDDGSAAIEFGFVAAPFLALVFAIMETGLVFFAGQTLETAASDSARLIMTGQAQSFDQGKFKEEVCKRVAALFNCATELQVDVRTYPSFSSIDTTTKPTINPDGTIKGSFGYNPGGPGDIVVVKLMYAYPVYVPPILGLNLADTANRRLLISTSAFRNEPYQGSLPSS